MREKERQRDTEREEIPLINTSNCSTLSLPLFILGQQHCHWILLAAREKREALNFFTSIVLSACIVYISSSFCRSNILCVRCINTYTLVMAPAQS